MASRLREMGRPRRIVLTPVILVHIQELEDVQGTFADHSFSELLESYLGWLKRDPPAPFIADCLPILQGSDRRRGLIQEEFEHLLDGLVTRLFPGAGNVRKANLNARVR
jgi:hypothetical protein